MRSINNESNDQYKVSFKCCFILKILIANCFVIETLHEIKISDYIYLNL